MNFATELLHGIAPDKLTGSTTLPIYQTAAYSQATAEDLEKIFANRKAGFVYSRIGNPTTAIFERRLADLERGAGAVAFSSGMAAVSAAIMNILAAGDEIISSGSLFGGTSALFRDLKDFGVKVRYVTENRVENFAALLTDNTKLIYAETIGNPKLDVTDIAALSKFAHENNLPLFLDSTVTTPYLVRPLELGADVVIHSTSKMINGGGNSIGGIVVVGKKFRWDTKKFPKLAEFKQFGAMSYLVRLRARMLTDFGGCPAPFNIFLTQVGLDTLALRMERACRNALELATFFAENKKVCVNYPGLENNFYHELANVQFNDHFGTMLTLRLGTKEKAFGFLNSLRFALKESNIGDVRTLAIHPASTIYLNATEGEKLNAGVSEDLIRVSVGIEDISDLLSDFELALQKI